MPPYFQLVSCFSEIYKGNIKNKILFVFIIYKILKIGKKLKIV